MQKSDIIFTVVLRYDKSKTLPQLRKDLVSFLTDEYYTDLERWDKAIDAPIANAMIQHMTLTGQRTSIKSLVRDIDEILQLIYHA